MPSLLPHMQVLQLLPNMEAADAQACAKSKDASQQASNGQRSQRAVSQTQGATETSNRDLKPCRRNQTVGSDAMSDIQPGM